MKHTLVLGIALSLAVQSIGLKANADPMTDAAETASANQIRVSKAQRLADIATSEKAISDLERELVVAENRAPGYRNGQLTRNVFIGVTVAGLLMYGVGYVMMKKFGSFNDAMAAVFIGPVGGSIVSGAGVVGAVGSEGFVLAMTDRQIKVLRAKLHLKKVELDILRNEIQAQK